MGLVISLWMGVETGKGEGVKASQSVTTKVSISVLMSNFIFLQ